MIEGFLIVVTFVLGTLYGWWMANHQKAEPKKEPEDTTSDLARQWWNIMAYDGTERGQIGADDADYDS